jgi:hypothetical protein
MKIEFLKDGARDCPLIRLYEFTEDDVRRLRQIALRLAKGRNEVVALHEEPGVVPIGGCQLTLHRAEQDRGVFQIALLKFEWVCAKSGWLTVAGLIRPFSRSNIGGWQWLCKTGKIAILFSRDGRW